MAEQQCTECFLSGNLKCNSNGATRCTACVGTNQPCYPKRLMHMHPRFSGSTFDANPSPSQVNRFTRAQSTLRQRQMAPPLPPPKVTKAEKNPYNPDELSRGKRKKLHGWARARDADPFGYTLPAFPAAAEKRYFNAFVEREGLYGSTVKPLRQKQEKAVTKQAPGHKIVMSGHKIEFPWETSARDKPCVDVQHQKPVAKQAQLDALRHNKIDFVRETSAEDQPQVDHQHQAKRPTEVPSSQSGGKQSQWKPESYKERPSGQNRYQPEASRFSKPAHFGFRPPPSNITAHASVSGLQRLGQYLRTAQDTMT